MASVSFDEHGQPSPALNARLHVERDVSELLGMAKGMLADGVVDDQEAQYLLRWASQHPEASTKWPVSLIVSRLTHMFTDGRIDDDERLELRDLLSSLIGGTESILLGYDASSQLALDEPPPMICWHEEVCVFTGRFAFGTRRHCQAEVLDRGGRCDENVTRQTTFLVLGTFGSTDWRHTSYGRKIERAVELRSAAFPLRIVGEDHWTKAIAPPESSRILNWPTRPSPAGERTR